MPAKTRKRSRGKRTKTIKRTSVKSLDAFGREIIVSFLQMLNTIKLYHWKTHSYATHKATDDLYTKLNDNVDKFIEVLMGKTQGRFKLGTKSLKIRDCSTHQEFKSEILKYKTYMVGLNNHKGLQTMSNADLFTIRDDILADLNQFLYLYTFK